MHIQMVEKGPMLTLLTLLCFSLLAKSTSAVFSVYKQTKYFIAASLI